MHDEIDRILEEEWLLQEVCTPLSGEEELGSCRGWL